jgi:hypothetical protein
MTGAPSGKGLLETGGYGAQKVEAIAAMRGRAEALGSPTLDEDGNVYWPDNDRGRIEPEGTGLGDYEDAEDGDDDRGTTGFFVKMSTFDEAKFSKELFDKYFVADGDRHVCRLCLVDFGWETEGRRHMESAHGPQSEPEHQHKYGNVVKKELRLFKRGKM